MTARRAPRRSLLTAVAVSTAVTVVAGIAVWNSVKPADAGVVSPGAYTGLGFDACTAPSGAAMAAWRKSSPYRAIGVYIGGVNRGCNQPNLTADWVRDQQGAGWHLLPLYVGLQAPCTGATGSTLIVPAQAAAQGRQAGDDAVARAKGLGMSAGSILVYDMEAYDNADVPCATAVLTFMSAWTIRLHESGYASGFYSSTSSGVAAQVTNYNKPGYVRPDYIDFANWDNVATVSDPGIPAGYWTPKRRIKQHGGPRREKYGGHEINIDVRYFDVRPLANAGMADFTGNGFADVLTRSSTGQLYLRPGHGSTLEAGRQIGTGWAGMNTVQRIGDLNRDGREDVIARQASTGNLYFYPGTGTGLGTRKLLGKGWGGLRELAAVGDVTGDAFPDLVAVQSSTGSLVVYPGRSGVRLGSKKQVGTGWRSLTELAGVGDFDRDGRNDFVARASTGTLRLYRGRAGSAFSGTDLQAGWSGRRNLVGVGDFDRDGFPDVAAVDSSDGTLRVHRGTGGGFAASFPVATGLGTHLTL